MNEPLWIFGYGSIIWKTEFPFIAESIGCLQGWARRFWQASLDHRGIPEASGRVVTLVPSRNNHCWGKLFLLEPQKHSKVIEALDHREKGGYERMQADIVNASGAIVKAVTYWAPQQNDHFLGPDSLSAMARQISRAQGPSGSNRDYLFKLESALRALGHPDSHVTILANKTRQLLGQS